MDTSAAVSVVLAEEGHVFRICVLGREALAKLEHASRSAVSSCEFGRVFGPLKISANCLRSFEMA